MAGRRLFRTAEALADLDSIWDYISRDNLLAADRMLDQLHERFNLIVQNPEIGEAQTLLADGAYRRVTCHSYVIYYRPLSDGIVILRVLHGAQDHSRLL